MGKHKTMGNLMLKLTNKNNYIQGGEILDWYSDHDFRHKDIKLQ